MMAVDSYRRDIDKGWAWIVLVAVYSAVVIISTSTFMGGILYVALLEHYGGDEAIVSLIGSLNTGLLCLFGPVASVYMNMFSCRVSIVSGGLLISLACFTSAFITNVNWLILTYGVLGGIGNSLVGTSLVVVLVYYFEKRRSTVISVSTAFIGFGMFLSAPMAQALLHAYGLSGAFLILSAFNAHLCAVGLVCAPSSLEKRIRECSRKYQHRQGAKDALLSDENKSALIHYLKRMASRFRFDLLRNPTFTVFMCSTMTWNFMLAVVLMHFPNYMTTQGASTIDITVIMTCFSVGNTAGRFLSASVVDRQSVDSLTMHILSLGIVGVITVTFPFYSHLNILKYGFAGLSGVLVGVPNALAAPILLQILGVELLSTAHGFEFFFYGIGSILGPPVAGFLFSETKTYTSSFYFSGTVVLVGAILGIVSSILYQRTKVKSETMDISAVNLKNKVIDEFEMEPPVVINDPVRNLKPLLDNS